MQEDRRAEVLGVKPSLRPNRDSSEIEDDLPASTIKNKVAEPLVFDVREMGVRVHDIVVGTGLKLIEKKKVAHI